MLDGNTLLDTPWLDAGETRQIADVLTAAGIDFRFVGGAVRDAVLGRPATDVDIATPVLPQAVMAALDKAGLKSIPTGIAHGTVTALAGGRHFEITTLRRDVETDGRHAVVAFTGDWKEDAARRDFTMNALYADRSGAVTDFFNGIADAKAGRVRFIGDPEKRITEDALRILRFFRFHAYYGHGSLDAEGLVACAQLAPLIDRLSGERVRDEVLKLLSAPDPVPVMQQMEKAGIASRAVGGPVSVDTLDRMVELETQLDLPADALRRLGALLGPDSQLPPARLKLSNRDGDILRAVSIAPGRVAAVTARHYGRALYGAPASVTRDAALLARAHTGVPDIPTLKQLLAFIAKWQEPRFPLTGDDALALGVAAGPALGRILAVVEEWWKAANFTPDRAACLAELERVVALTR